jgi:hypothetical protein
MAGNRGEDRIRHGAVSSLENYGINNQSGLVSSPDYLRATTLSTVYGHAGFSEATGTS